MKRLTETQPQPINHDAKRNSFSTAGIAAAAIAAITISAGVHRRHISSDTSGSEFQTPRRRNRYRTIYDTGSYECGHPGCHCRPIPRDPSGSNRQCVGSLKVQTHGSSSDSCSESKPCAYCLETLTETNTCNCCETSSEDAQNVGEVQHRPIHKPFGQHSEAHLLQQQCPVHVQYPVRCYALDECCCEHQSLSNTSPQIPLLPPPLWAVPNSNRADLPSSEFSSTSGWPIETCCAQRIRHASPIVSSSNICRKKHVHPTQVSSCDCNRWSTTQTQKVKTLKAAKPRPAEQRVQARRIRHPKEDSNSESELGPPVIDVRALRSTSARLSTSSSQSGQPKAPFHSPSKLSQPVSSSPIAVGPAKVYSCLGPFQTSLQTNPCTLSSSTNSNVYTNRGPQNIQPPRTAQRLQSTSSSESSSTSARPESNSSTSTSTSSWSYSDLSDSPASSNVLPYPYPVDPSASTSYSCQHHPTAVHLRNPFHTYYHGPHEGPPSSGGSALPISSGDFWNVRRGWLREFDHR